MISGTLVGRVFIVEPFDINDFESSVEGEPTVIEVPEFIVSIGVSDDEGISGVIVDVEVVVVVVSSFAGATPPEFSFIPVACGVVCGSIVSIGCMVVSVTISFSRGFVGNGVVTGS